MSSNSVLVVEDDPLNMKLFRKILTLSGYEVLEATAAKAGIHLALTRLPSVIVMDIQLPGMSGLDAVSILRGRNATVEIPVIAVTGYATEADKTRCLEAGCDEFLTKPIDTKLFSETVRKYMPDD